MFFKDPSCFSVRLILYDLSNLDIFKIAAESVNMQ